MSSSRRQRDYNLGLLPFSAPMRLFLPVIVVAAAACASTPSSRSPVRALSIQHVPEQVGAFSQTETKRFNDPGAGALYRYRGASPLQPDVFIYPLVETARAGGGEPLARARAATIRAA